MPGEDLAILGKGAESVTNLLTDIAGGALSELNAMWADRIREKRFERALKRLEGVANMCEDAGIPHPRPVAFRILVPWLENASIENDEPSLHEMWEALLANAADPREERKETHRSFVRILNQIEAPERKVLEALYYLDMEVEAPDHVIPSFADYPGNDDIRTALGEVGFADQMSDERLQFAKSNLIRLGLCSRGSRDVVGGGGLLGGAGFSPPEPQIGPGTVHINAFGRTFYEACQPPEGDVE